MKDSYPRKSRWAVFGRDPVWWHRLLLAEWNSQILPPISESTRGQRRTPRPGHRQFAPQLFLTTDPAVPRWIWPPQKIGRGEITPVTYFMITLWGPGGHWTHGPGIFCNEKLNCRLNIQVDLHHNYSEVNVWVKGTLYKDLSFITILRIDKGSVDMWPLTCTFLPKVGLMTWWHWWPLGTSIYSLPYLTKSDQHVIKKLQ